VIADHPPPHLPTTQGLILLCEVALGDPNELTQADYNADRLPPGRHSTKGVGRTQPDPAETVVMPDGVAVPLGKPVSVSHLQGKQLALLYNEYIVYRADQLRIRYMLQVEFVY